jgi:DNA-binding CsgD family transcriptional regulator
MKRREVMALLYASGQTGDQVAIQFGVARRTVIEHIGRVRRENGLNTKIDLYKHFKQKGLLHD